MNNSRPISSLDSEVRFLKGVGEARGELLGRLGLKTIRDLLFYVPRDVLDLTQVKQPRDLTGKSVESVRGKLVDRDARKISGNRTLTALLLDCGDGDYVRGTWFNQPWMLKRYNVNDLLLFSGKPKHREGRWEFGQPDVKVLVDDDAIDGGIQPRYGLTEGLTQEHLRRICRTAVELHAAHLADPLPREYRDAHDLLALPAAVTGLHCPTTVDEFTQAKRRVLYDDLFEFQLGMALRRRMWSSANPAPQFKATAKINARIRRLFQFEFTTGQDQAIRDILIDMNSGRAMHRLLQADVGAGKTVIAIYAMLVAIAHGYQAIVMAPTEVLANQHWRTIDHLLRHSRVRRTLLTGRLTPAQRRDRLRDIQHGDVDLVVGTQALIQDGVAIPKLGIAVIDEQHKFGVAQRGHFSLNDAQGHRPHVLVMTATPIPRTLCLTTYGDLDITKITDVPPGRQRVVTSRVRGVAGRGKAWEFIRKQLQNGRQAYVIAPRIDERDDADEDVSGSVEAIYDDLIQGELRDASVALLHGRMDGPTKSHVMSQFNEGDTQVLVSTTVVEVGVDVPNATLMIIYQAERFGLSQLHQLRGRIARGTHQGYCFLFTENENPEAISRLGVMEQTADGFRIAEADYDLRGPGDVLGLRQSGQTSLRVADLTRDVDLVEQVRDDAQQLVDSGDFDTPPFAALKRTVLERFDFLTDLGQGG